MTPSQLNQLIITPALTLLGARYNTPQARAMMIAIALQESDLRSRRQNGGPAKSLWQFEISGIDELWTRPVTLAPLKSVCGDLCYTLSPATILAAIEDNDILGACCARLLLFSSPKQMPAKSDMMGAWALYNHDLWQPGKPRYETWPDNWAKAWEAVEAK